MDKKALIYGAGAIGRGYLAPLLNKYGIKISFVDVDDNLVSELKSRKSYKTAITGDKKYEFVDVNKNTENEYAEHCKEVDILSGKLRDCITYYNGEGKAEPGSLSYYGGNQWHKIRTKAQEDLKPYQFT